MTRLVPLQPKSDGDRVLALFDFDGTLTTGDSFIAMLRYQIGVWNIAWGIARWSPWLLGYSVGLVSRTRIKELVLNWLFGGWYRSEIEHTCRHFSHHYLHHHIRKDALSRMLAHRDRGDQVVVVSASPVEWVKPWCDHYQVACITTHLDYHENGHFTGRLKGANCYGEEKVRRIRQVYPLEAFQHIYAYGDTPGDLPMLSLAQFPGYKVFRESAML